jgi:hypothetical protein
MVASKAMKKAEPKAERKGAMLVANWAKNSAEQTAVPSAEKKADSLVRSWADL